MTIRGILVPIGPPEIWAITMVSIIQKWVVESLDTAISPLGESVEHLPPILVFVIEEYGIGDE